MLRIDVELWVSWHFYVHSFRQTDARFRIKFGWHTTNFRKSGASCCRVVVVSCFVIFTAFDVATYLNNFYVVYSVGTPRALLPVVPGQAGGGSFQKEKNYIAKKEFAYRMCARRPTSAMPKSFLCLCSPSAVPWW